MQSFEKPLSLEEEKYYLSLSREGDLEARNILVEHNLRLVAHIVKKYYNFERDMDDLISIGTIGLIKAINTYNDQKGNRLVTYASRCIENELLMMLRKEKKYSRDISLYECGIIGLIRKELENRRGSSLFVLFFYNNLDDSHYETYYFVNFYSNN